MICEKKHRDLDIFDSLPEAQDNQKGDRHACAGCAYEEGLKDGLSKRVKQIDFSHLPRSQAGTVRHKDAVISYNLGYNYGVQISN